MLKTTMGMLGEYEYDTVYNDNEVPPVTWVLYVAFLVINCIIIMNLLVSSIRISFYILPWLLEVTEILVVEDNVPCFLSRLCTLALF